MPLDEFVKIVFAFTAEEEEEEGARPVANDASPSSTAWSLFIANKSVEELRGEKDDDEDEEEEALVILPHFDSRYRTIRTFSSTEGQIFSWGSDKRDDDDDEDDDSNNDDAASVSEATDGKIEAGAPIGGSKPISSTVEDFSSSLIVDLTKEEEEAFLLKKDIWSMTACVVSGETAPGKHVCQK